MFLFNQSRYFQNLLESLPSGTLIFNAAGQMYAINSMAAAMLGMSREGALEDGWERLLAGAGEPEALSGLLRLTSAERRGDECVASRPVPVRFERDDGAVLHLNVGRSLLREYEKTFGILLTLTDVTEIHESYERERAVLRENARMQEGQARRLRQFSMAVAHQVRNPLQIIGGYARILERKLEGNSVAAPYLEGILEGGDRLGAVVDAVARYSGLALGDMEETDLGEVLAQARSCCLGEQLCRDSRGFLPVEIEWDVCSRVALPGDNGLGAGLPLAEVGLVADLDLLAKALSELFLNAAEFCEKDVVRIRVRGAVFELGPGQRVLELAVEDDGPGISSEFHEFLFDPFYTTKAVGVGMGLCMAERILREHGGGLRLEAQAAPGARAVVFLPLSGVE